jgi:heavy metal sensor kinase
LNRLSIRWRIALWNTAAFAVVLLGFGVAVYGLLRQTHYDQLDRSLVAKLRGIADRPLSAETPPAPRRWLDGRRNGIVGYVLDREGRVVEQTGQLDSVGASVPIDRSADGPRFDSLNLPELGHVRRMAAPLPAGNRDLTLVLLAELEHVDEEMAQVLRALLITAPITLLVAITLAYFLAYKALAPVEELRQLTDEITAERLDRRLPIRNASDELGLLAQTINSMITRLERSFHEVRRFTADASHELRTPVSIIRSEAELGLTGGQIPDSARRRFESIVEECARLADLTQHLLALCREEAGVAQVGRAPVHLASLISESTDVMRPLAEAKQQRLEIEIKEHPVVRGNADRLRQVCCNLLENAIKYTLAGGEVSVRLDRHDGEAVLTVCDRGIGIPPEHLPHIFERFYQAESGRSQAGAGAGLGLSIVQSIVEAHGGRIEVTSESGAGSVFRVFLPESCPGPPAATQETDADSISGARPITQSEVARLQD